MEEIKVPAWREAAREARPDIYTIYAKKLRAERVLKKLGRHFVVLLVGPLGHRGDGAAVHHAHEVLEATRGRLDVTRLDVAQPLTAQPADSGAYHAVGHPTLFGPLEDGGRACFAVGIHCVVFHSGAGAAGPLFC